MQWKITRVMEVTDLGDNGRAVPHVRLEFTVGPHGPFSITLPKTGYTAAGANAKIQQFVTELNATQGLQ